MQDRINKLGRDIIRGFRRFKPHPEYRTLRRELKNGKKFMDCDPTAQHAH